jgi:AraC-like DNA-binding protein
MAVLAQSPSRRDRLRAATTQEIIQTARRLLVEQGAEAVSLRAIAREMGMTAPALYRYFGSHESSAASSPRSPIMCARPSTPPPTRLARTSPRRWRSR